MLRADSYRSEATANVEQRRVSVQVANGGVDVSNILRAEPERRLSGIVRSNSAKGTKPLTSFSTPLVGLIRGLQKAKLSVLRLLILLRAYLDFGASLNLQSDFFLCVVILFRGRENDLGAKLRIGVIASPGIPIQHLVDHVDVAGAGLLYVDVLVLLQ